MSSVDTFAKYIQLALHLHKVGRPGLLPPEDFQQLRELRSGLEWSLYRNSMGITHLSSPEGDHIQIDDKGITVFGPSAERR
jgi:hypothetical protein